MVGSGGNSCAGAGGGCIAEVGLCLVEDEGLESFLPVEVLVVVGLVVVVGVVVVADLASWCNCLAAQASTSLGSGGSPPQLWASDNGVVPSSASSLVEGVAVSGEWSFLLLLAVGGMGSSSAGLSFSDLRRFSSSLQILNFWRTAEISRMK